MKRISMKKLPILLAVLLLLLVPPAIFLNVRQGVAAGDSFLLFQDERHYRADAQNEIILSPSEVGTDFDILLHGQSSSARLTWNGDRARIEFDDGNVVEGDWDGSTLVNLAGVPSDLLTNPSSAATVSADVVNASLLGAALCRMDLGATSSAGSLLLVILGVIVYIFGMLNAFWPQGMYLLLSRFHYNYQELSDDSGRRAQIFSGIVAMLIGAACMYATLLL